VALESGETMWSFSSGMPLVQASGPAGGGGGVREEDSRSAIQRASHARFATVQRCSLTLSNPR